MDRLPEYLIYGADPDTARILQSLPGARPASPPSLVLLCGLPGAGKSHFQRALRLQTGAVALESDALRKLLVGAPTYSGEENGRLFRAIRSATRRLLAGGYSVIIDATNLTERERRPFYRIAERLGARLYVVRVTAPDDIVYARLDRRLAGDRGADNSDAGREVYERMREAWRDIPRSHLVVDSSADIGPAVQALAKAMETP
jgi:hypothetical protein